jgi:EAL domain-containing protein (putative c-di-GMP-specific phosphodiesterase class I)/CheY-like chemotaxis protein
MNDLDHRLRLLVVDDDAAFGRLVKRCAEPLGFDVMLSDGVSCREKVASWHPVMILLDLNMPCVDGIEILRHLSADRCPANIVLTSGSVDGRTLEAAARLGSERGLSIGGILGKPARSATLRQMLGRLTANGAAITPAALAEAIEGDQLFLEFQPVLDCHSGRIAAAEALVRWRHPVSGVVPPDRFIKIAEDSGLIDPLTDWVFAGAVREAACWHRRGFPLGVAVNLSGRNLSRVDVPERLERCCLAAAIAPEHVVLELTETHAMADAVQAMEIVTRLRLKGFKLSIDDFGTGYSSLVQLRRLPFSELKIDRSFVADLTRQHESREIAETIVTLAHKIGLQCVAEGVETKDTLDALVAMGCDCAQGYYISRPIAGARVVDLAVGYGNSSAAARR